MNVNRRIPFPQLLQARRIVVEKKKKKLKKVSQFLLLTKLGCGVSSKVYLAHDETYNDNSTSDQNSQNNANSSNHSSNGYYAIKTIRIHERRFDGLPVKCLEREIKILHILKHPNIIKLYDVLYSSSVDRAYFIMEWADCNTLQSHITNKVNFDERSIASIFLQIANALNYIHSHCMVHNDVKPSNILIFSDGSAKLSDFGIGRSFGSAETVIGTPSYQAPELFYEDDSNIFEYSNDDSSSNNTRITRNGSFDSFDESFLSKSDNENNTEIKSTQKNENKNKSTHRNANEINSNENRDNSMKQNNENEINSNENRDNSMKQNSENEINSNENEINSIPHSNTNSINSNENVDEPIDNERAETLRHNFKSKRIINSVENISQLAMNNSSNTIHNYKNIQNPIELDDKRVKLSLYVADPPKRDVWSFGVSLYQTLFGQLPYNGWNLYEILRKIKKQHLTIPKTDRKCSPELIDLLHQILEKDPDKRLSIQQIINHPFFTKYYIDPNSVEINDQNRNEYIIIDDTKIMKKFPFPYIQPMVPHKDETAQIIQISAIEYDENYSFLSSLRSASCPSWTEHFI